MAVADTVVPVQAVLDPGVEHFREPFRRLAVLHVAWIVIVVLGSILTIIYSIVQFVVHLRDRHVRKEEFHSALKGD